MRLCLTIFSVLTAFSITAQQPLTFKDVLKTTREIKISDSILITVFLKKDLLDEKVGSNLFTAFYRQENRSPEYTNYSVAGKITSHTDFDILFLVVDRLFITGYTYGWGSMRIPSGRLVTNELFFVLLDKKGKYKNNFLAALTYQTITDSGLDTTRTISSRIYSDHKIVQNTEVEFNSSPSTFLTLEKTGPKTIKFTMEYRINDYGLFVAYPKY